MKIWLNSQKKNLPIIHIHIFQASPSLTKARLKINDLLVYEGKVYCDLFYKILIIAIENRFFMR